MNLPKKVVVATGLVAVVMAAMVVMWLIATIHHSLLAKSAPPAPVDKTL